MFSNARVPNLPDVVYGLSVVKGRERYCVLYTPATRVECLKRLGRWAANPELSFTWYDAAVCAQQIRADERREREEAV